MKLRKTMLLLSCMAAAMAVSAIAFASENSEKPCEGESIQTVQIEPNELEAHRNGSDFVETIDLGNGLECNVYSGYEERVEEEAVQNIAISPEEIKDNADNRVFVETIDLGNGLECSIYEGIALSTYADGTISKTNDFELSYEGTFFGYLSQTTSWSYDGVNRPTLLSYSDTFHSTDPSKNYLSSKGSSTSTYGTSSRKYTLTAEVYYNSKYIATTDFSTICDKNGNLSFISNDV